MLSVPIAAIALVRILSTDTPAAAPAVAAAPAMAAAAPGHDTASSASEGNVYRGRANELSVKIPRLDESPKIDGDLDKPVWGKAAILTDFSEYSPADGRPAEDSTQVLVWYSANAIYFGVRAFESHGAVHTTLANRDKIDGDDNVQIILNTFHEGRRALVFAANPVGIQEDGTMDEGNGIQGNNQFNQNTTNRPVTDLNPDYVYDSKGRITPFGYEIEIRVPFKSIKYQAAETQDWAINIIRVVQHSGHVDSWAPVKRAASSFLGQSGTLVGLNNLHHDLVLDLNPIVTEHSFGSPPASGTGWHYGIQHPEFGGNIRYGITSNLALSATVNPDFAEVESDVTQLAYDPRISLYYPDKRPYFLEGLEQFATPSTLIYTRDIIQPVGSAKLAGTVAGNSVAFLSAVDEQSASESGHDNPLFNILRVQHNVGADSKIGLVLTDKEDGAAFNRLGGLDAHVPFAGVYTLDLQGVEASTRDSGHTVLAPLWMAHLTRTGRNFGFDYIINGLDPNFHAWSGFILRPGIVHANITNHLTAYGPPHALIESVSGDVFLDGTWEYGTFTHGGAVEEKMLHFDNTATLRGGWAVTASIFFERFLYDTALFSSYRLGHISGVDTTYTPYVGSSHLSNTDYVLRLVTPQFSTFFANAFVLWGRDDNFFEWSAANIIFANLTLDWRPTNKLRMEALYNAQYYRRFNDNSIVGTHLIPRLKFEYQLSRPIFIRLVGQYDAQHQDSLRDNSRTNLPIFLFDPTTNTYSRAAAYTTNSFRLDWLFSYQPTPGTVFFFGYGNTSTEPLSLRFQALRRTTDDFFVKFSYLWRM